MIPVLCLGCITLKPKYTVSYLAGEGGSILGASEQKIKSGEKTEEVTARANEGYEFIGWSDGNKEAVRKDFNIQKDLTVTAEFKKLAFTVVYTAGDNGRIEGEQNQTIEYGNNANTVTALPNEGYEFVRWSDTESTDPVRTDKNIKQNISAEAIFNKLILTVNYSAGDGGRIDGELKQTIEYGNDASTVKAIYNEGYEFVKWSDGNLNPIRRDLKVTENITVEAIFKKIVYTIEYKAGENGRIDGDLKQTVEYGNDATTVTAIPNEGYEFVRWSDNNSTEPVRTDKGLKRNIFAKAIFTRITFTVEYIAGENGRIDGELNQIVEYGNDANTVTALPNKGYKFVKWSDTESTEPVRADTNIKENIYAEAIFVLIERKYTFEYNGATGNNTEKEVTINYINMYDMEFTVPVKEGYTFDGWFLDKEYTVRIADRQGFLLEGNIIMHKLFDYPSNTIYAKWTTKEILSYRILMVFTSNVVATLKGNNDEMVDVNYTMSSIEHTICEMIGPKLEDYLNELVEGLVEFQIDTYFTKDTITKEYIHKGSDAGLRPIYSITTEKLPELQGILDNYRSVATTLGLNSYDGKLNAGGGFGSMKYASLFMENIFGGLIGNNQPVEWLLDLSIPGFERDWQSLLKSYTHELTHTMEMACGKSNFHTILSKFVKIGGPTESTITKLYLQNLLEVDGEKVGIPADYWIGYKEITYIYNGATGNCDQKTVIIPYKENAGEQLVVPTKEGFTFDGWFTGQDFTKSRRASDANGKVWPSGTIFVFGTDSIYAKWIPN